MCGCVRFQLVGFNPRPLSRANDPVTISPCVVGAKISQIANLANIERAATRGGTS